MAHGPQSDAQFEQMAEWCRANGHAFDDHGPVEADASAAWDAHRASLVEAVKAHALAHYAEGGWDVIVECWDDQQIAEHLAQSEASSAKSAVDAFRGVVSVWADRQADARNSAF